LSAAIGHYCPKKLHKPEKILKFMVDQIPFGRGRKNRDIEFGPYRLTGDGELYCPNDVCIQLTERLDCILSALAAANGTAVSRHDLIERCWSDDAVGEDSLTRAIADLRKIFRAHGEDCIETVYGLGYRVKFEQPNQDLREKIAFCQQARIRVYQRQRATLLSAEQLFSQALERDEEYLPALLGLAETQIHSMQLGYTTTMESAPKAFKFLERALDLDPLCADALSMRGVLHTWAEWDFAAAEADLKRARAQSPNTYLANQAAVWHSLAVGEFESAELHSKAARVASPLAATAMAGVAFARFYQGDDVAALEAAREMIRIDAHGAVSLGLAAIFEAALGTPARAVDMASRCFELLPESPVNGAILAYALARDGRLEKARTLLDSETRSGLPIGSNTVASPAWIELGENDLALAVLESGFATRCCWLLQMLNDPRIACLNCEPLKASIFK